MKKKSFFPLLITSLFVGLVFFFSCDNEIPGIEKVVKPQSPAFSANILERSVSLPDGLNLPIGTKWYYADRTQTRVRFTLPAEYVFLLQNEQSGEYRISLEGEYSCTCSKAGESCIVFYHPELGFGCLQGTCTGTCTGRLKGGTEEIKALLNNTNTELDVISDNIQPVTLSKEDMAGFLSVPTVKNQLNDAFEQVYANYPKPDFNSIDITNLPEPYGLLRAYIFGVELGIVIPRDNNMKKFEPRLSFVEDNGGITCSCSGGGGTSCPVSKECLPFPFQNNCVYYCSGCNTCTMRVPEE